MQIHDQAQQQHLGRPVPERIRSLRASSRVHHDVGHQFLYVVVVSQIDERVVAQRSVHMYEIQYLDLIAARHEKRRRRTHQFALGVKYDEAHIPALRRRREIQDVGLDVVSRLSRSRTSHHQRVEVPAVSRGIQSHRHPVGQDGISSTGRPVSFVELSGVSPLRGSVLLSSHPLSPVRNHQDDGQLDQQGERGCPEAVLRPYDPAGIQTLGECPQHPRDALGHTGSCHQREQRHRQTYKDCRECPSPDVT